MNSESLTKEEKNKKVYDFLEPNDKYTREELEEKLDINLKGIILDYSNIFTEIKTKKEKKENHNLEREYYYSIGIRKLSLSLIYTILSAFIIIIALL